MRSESMPYALTTGRPRLAGYDKNERPGSWLEDPVVPAAALRDIWRCTAARASLTLGDARSAHIEGWLR
jgi:hypothetical protein